jgi:hypothetical protein
MLAEAVAYLGQEFHDVVEQGFRINIHKLHTEEKRIKRLMSMPRVRVA